MAVKEGFYPDPDTAGLLRYWDGRQWTTTIQPTPLPTKPPRFHRRAQIILLVVILVLLVMVMMILFWVLGVFGG